MSRKNKRMARDTKFLKWCFEGLGRLYMAKLRFKTLKDQPFIFYELVQWPKIIIGEKQKYWSNGCTVWGVYRSPSLTEPEPPLNWYRWR
jgi:hypothetical protein